MGQFASPLVWPEPNIEMNRVSGGSDIYVMNADGSNQTRLTKTHGLSADQAAWSPEGQRMAYVSLDAENRTVSLVLADSAGRLQSVVASGREHMAPAAAVWAPAGQRIAYIGPGADHPEVFVLDVGTGATRQITSSGAVQWSRMTWSPDGARLAFAAPRGEAIWVSVVGAEGGPLTPLVEGYGPSWSPDGQRIAFSTERDGRSEIFSVRPDGSDLRQLTTTSSTYVQQPGSWRPAWSPDGQRIAFSSNRSGTSDVFVMDADGGNPVNLTDSPGLNSFAPAWLPDGRLSYTARGRERDLAEGNALGVAGILLQAGLLIGVVLVAARRWRLPLGACTFVFVLDAVLMSFQNDLFQFIPAAALAGVVADLVLFRLGPLGMASAGGVRRLAFIVPAVYFAGYFAALALTQGVGWTVHLWAGSIVLAGLVGLLLSYLVVFPLQSRSA